MHDFETAKKQYEEAKHAMIEAQVWMEEAVRNFDGTIQEALDAGMIRLNFPQSHWAGSPLHASGLLGGLNDEKVPCGNLPIRANPRVSLDDGDGNFDAS